MKFTTVILIQCIFAIALTATLTIASDLPKIEGVKYVENYQAPQPGGKDEIQLIRFVGKQEDYNLTSDAYARHLQSDAICGKIVTPNSKHPFTIYGPCSTSVKEHIQILTVNCVNDPKSYADLEFFPSDGSSNATATINTYGKIFAGFEVEQGPLQQSSDINSPLFATYKNSSAVFNCNGDSRNI